MDEIRELQSWFLARCDGGWEHQFGIKIESLDNPGWAATIDLHETELENRRFVEVRDRYEHDTDRLRCWRQEGRFEIRCGPTRFAEALRVFLSWAGT